MQEFSTGRCPSIVETNDAFINGVRGIAQRMSFNIRGGLRNLPGRNKQTFFRSTIASLKSGHEVAIMYSGHASKFLRMTSERMVIPTGRYTLGQLLCSLYKRGDRWVDELDDSHLKCMVNGREAQLFDTIEPGAEIRIFSQKVWEHESRND